ncbi:SLC13 family permease [Echinicola sediminis]
MEIALVIGLLVIAVVLFATEKLSIDIVTLLVLIILVLFGVLNPREAFSAFSSDFIIMLASIFVITAAIEISGIMDFLTEYVSKTKTAEVVGIILWMTPLTALVSGLMNNTTLTALMVPPLLGIARRFNISPSKLLMPMAFASIVGGCWTIIGTSTNIAVRGYLFKEGFGQLGIFSIAPIGLTMVGVFVIYMFTVGRFLIPDRKVSKLLEEYKVRDYMSEVKILKGSNLIGQKVFESGLSNSGFRILSIIRDKVKFYPDDTSEFRENDLLLVYGNVKDLLAVKEKAGISIMADTLNSYYKNEQNDEMHLMEVLIPAISNLVGKTVKKAEFAKRYGLMVVAAHRAGNLLFQTIGSLRLQAGDLLLVQGTAKGFANISDQHNLVLLEAHKINHNRIRKGIITIALFASAILLTTLEVIPSDIAFLSAAVTAALFRTINPEDVYRAIDWKLLVLIGGMTAFGTAMENSGADVFISEQIISVFKPFGEKGIMLGFMVITVLLTQPMSNAAAALVVLPVALQSALMLEVNPLTFGIAIMLSASVSIVTPFEPSCLLIFNAGKYKFSDFIKVGGPLTLLLLAVIFFMVPLFWPLKG